MTDSAAIRQSPTALGDEAMTQEFSARTQTCLWFVIDALLQGARRLEVTPELAHDLVIQTVVGAATLLERTGQEPALLRQRITSPGGTTERALAVLREHDAYAALVAAARGPLSAAQGRSESGAGRERDERA